MKPDVYFFNPTCELAVANASMHFMAPARLRQFEHELSTLPGILAQPGDIVLVNRIPAPQFTDQMRSAGFSVPIFREVLSSLGDPDFLSEAKGFLFPWGWSPAAHKMLSPLKPGCCPEFQNSPVAEWREKHRELFSRKSALTILQQIAADKISNNTITFNDLPEICTSHDQIRKLQQKWGKVVVKAPWSSSGRGLQILRPDEYNQTNRQVITGFLKQQGYVVAGPWHNKLLDLSFQFFSLGNGAIEYRGLTSFFTDHLGRYAGNYIRELPPDLAPELKEFLLSNIPGVKQALHKTLTVSEFSTNYYGWIGVDTVIWRSASGALKFHPCLEINCRFTMGAIALSLRKHLAERSTGEFMITHGKAGYLELFCEEMKVKMPLVIENGKIVSGFLPVTPISPESSFGAYISIMEMKE